MTWLVMGLINHSFVVDGEGRCAEVDLTSNTYFNVGNSEKHYIDNKLEVKTFNC